MSGRAWRTTTIRTLSQITCSTLRHHQHALGVELQAEWQISAPLGVPPSTLPRSTLRANAFSLAVVDVNESWKRLQGFEFEFPPRLWQLDE
jgi:hypothetical protein